MPYKPKKVDFEFNVMLAHKYDPKRIPNWRHVIAEPKLDGARVIIVCKLHKDSVCYYSRNGRQLFMFAHIDREVLKFTKRAAQLYDERFAAGTVLDGEMTHLSGEFSDISGAIHTKDFTEIDARFSVFHAMPLSSLLLGVDDVAQRRRINMCAFIVKKCNLEMIQHHAGREVLNDDDVQRVYQRHLAAGYEGTIVKQTRIAWEGKRSYTWMKMKPQETADVVITGMKQGTGKYAGTLGALEFDYQGKKCFMSGMTDEQRRRWWFERDSDRSVIGRTMEVEYQLVTAAGSLRHPRFKRFRNDK